MKRRCAQRSKQRKHPQGSFCVIAFVNRRILVVAMKRSGGGAVRPWDKKRPAFGHRKRSIHTTTTSNSNNNDNNDAQREEIPYVEIFGVRYLSDRFYLHKTDFRRRDNEQKQEGVSQSCTCGAQEAPILLDRQALIESLNLQCAVIATYTIDKRWLSHAFPTLCGPNATVPTLVLHGRQDPREQLKKEDGDDDDNSSQTSSILGDDEEESPPLWESMYEKETAGEKNADNDDLSIGTQPDDVQAAAAADAFAWDETTHVTQSPAVAFSPHVRFTQIAPTWLPPPEMADIVLQRKVLRERKHGVYHPKYMLLVEKSGSLVVVVSTSNLTMQCTTDASWIQRFPAVAGEASMTATSATNNNDFGPVLHDFLVQQSRAAYPGPDVMTPLKFWKRFAPHSLRDGWDYSQAQVDLVPHVPGDYPIDSTSYGRQRVQHILQQRAMTLPRLSPNDRLVMQPTSLGADWKVDNMIPVMKSYLPVRKIDTQQDLEMLQRLDIIWPTDDWVQTIKFGKAGPSPVSVTQVPSDVEVSRSSSGSLFLSSTVFNRIHTDCLARMGQWEPTMQHPRTLVPHIKSVTRLLHHRPPGVTEGFAWFLLTSACLSQGAQGLQTTRGERDVVTYRNFELGVLFCSQRTPPMSTQPSRIYCFRPTRCTCQPNSNPVHSNQRLVHLPLPFQCRPCPYTEFDGDDDEEAEDQVLHFSVSPFFHDIPRGTSAIGNMLLTPYGRAAMLQQKN